MCVSIVLYKLDAQKTQETEAECKLGLRSEHFSFFSTVTDDSLRFRRVKNKLLLERE